MKNIHLIGASSLAIFAAMPLAAQTADRSGVGDIVVTATKRAQSLQDVPISVSVTSSETLKQANITDIIDLQSVVPSLKVYQLQNTGQTGFSIRGFGNGTGNAGIEASVGVFIDGVYRSRSASSLSDLPEVERIEVLRGPQSTLFGKNVSVGAISIVTKAPNFKWGGWGEATIGNYGEILAKGSINAPLSDTVAVRLYGSVDQRDGYSTNITPGVPGKINDRNRWSLRGDVLWKPSAKFSLRVIADYSNIDEICCTAVYTNAGPVTQLIGVPAALSGGLGLGKAISNYNNNPYQTSYNTLPTNKLKGQGISAEANLQLGFAKLTSITAYRDQKYDVVQDIDFSGADAANQVSSDHYKTFTQEFRLTSTGSGPFSWLVGGFYGNEDIATGRNLTFGQDAYTLLNNLVIAQTRGAASITKLEGALHFINPAIIPGKTYFQPGQGISDNWDMKDTSFSFFGQADYKLTPQLTITGGLAYLNDHKAVTSNVDLSHEPFSLLNLNNIPQLALLGLPTGVFAGLGSLQFYRPQVNIPHAAITLNPNTPTAAFDGTARTVGYYGTSIPAEDGILNGSQLTYTGRVAYELTRHFNVYASYSTGWKAGAYNLSSDSTPPDANGYGRSAQPEKLTVYEIGLKTRFRGGFVNIAAFNEVVKGFQSNAFTGTGFALTNAGQESTKGVEIDTSYAPISPLVFNVNATYLEAKFDSFAKAACTTLATVNPCTGNNVFHDVSGNATGDVPKWSVSASAVYTANLGHGYSSFLRGEYDYTSSYLSSNTVPAAYSTSSVSSVNASLGISTPYKLDLTFWVRNLTKDNSLIASFNTVIQSGSYSAYPNEPRRYGVTIRKTF
jgi:iron complex outermembrane receptor protein